MKKLVSLIILTLLFTSLFAGERRSSEQTKVKMSYSLPLSVLDININLERKVFQKGVFAAYAEKYLGVASENVIKEDSELWSLKEIKLDSHREVDPSAFYSLEMMGSYQALKLNLSPEGCIVGFNANSINIPEDNKLDINVSSNSNPEKMVLESFCIDRPFKIKQDTSISLLTEDGEVQEHSKVKGKRVLKTPEQKAADAAHELFKLRKRRFKILTCNYDHLPADGRSYEIIIDQLNKLEKAYLELFLGRTSTYTETKKFSYTPQSVASSEVVARYSSKVGFVDVKNVAGIPIIVDLKNVVVDKDSRNSLSVQVQGGKYLHHRIPARAEVEIYEGRTLVGSKNMIIPQLGVVSNISLDLLLDENLTVEYHSSYGSIKKISSQIIKD